MKILLLGATGRTGKLVLETALRNDHELHCLARNVERITPQKGLQIFDGDPANEQDLKRALAGCDAIISVLNISRKSDFPWSKLRTPERYLSKVMKTLVSVCEQGNVERVVVCSAWGVAETRQDIPGWFRWFIDHSNIGVAYQDHERQEQILISSKLDWTIVRPVGLTDTKKPQNVRLTFDNTPKPSLTISRLSVAQFMIDCITSESLIGKKPTISRD
ncbi:MAG: NAD(P)-binding oxidoreductase [Bacteroidota bacterium]